MIDDRRLNVLRAIVDEFVVSHEPVGSKAIAERHIKGVSPATIRNDMASLEDDGLIQAPHTSAGRIPTEKGYRFFVDRLSQVKPLSPAERSAIDRFLMGAVDLDDIMLRTTKLLAQLTGQVAIVQYPSLSNSTLRHLELVPVAGSRILLVVIADTGRVEQRVVDLGIELTAANVEELRQKFNAALSGKSFSTVPSAVSNLLEALTPEFRSPAAVICSCLMETLVERPDEKIVVSGTSNLVRRSADWKVSMAPLLEAIEEQVVLLKLLEEAAGDSEVQVRIGHEHHIDSLSTAAVVASAYGNPEQAIGRLGVMGSTHMDYAGSMAAVSAVARYVGKIVAES